MSVWESVEALKEFTYRSDHQQLVRGRRDWFFPNQGPTMALWWVPAGHIPEPSECMERLELIRSEGPGPRAFMFSKVFDPE